MAAKTLEIIDFSKIQSFSVKVTEEIGDKYLLDFLRTSLENQQLELTNNSKFYYTFIPLSLLYEIIFFEDLSNESIPEPFIFIERSNPYTKELFITQNYFCLFDSQQLILYKDIHNILQEDIQTYIEQLYKIKIDKVTLIDKEKYDETKSQFLNNSKKYSFNFYSVKKGNSFNIFLSFIFLVTLCFGFFVYISLNSNYQITTVYDNTAVYEKGYKELLTIYKEIEKKPIKKAVSLFDYLSSSNILIEKLSYKNSKLYVVLLNSSRTMLLQSITNYTKNIEIESIQFDKNLNQYRMDIIVDVKK
jgi:hypothetical protein